MDLGRSVLGAQTGLNTGKWRNRDRLSRVVLVQERRSEVLLLVLLAILAIILFGVGFTVHWLFVLAIVAALLFVISFFMGAAGGRSRGAWW